MVKAAVWLQFADYFIQAKKDYERCLISLQKLEAAQRILDCENWRIFGYCIKAWQGHMFDLLGRRDEAIICYQEALDTNHGRNDNYFGGCMQIDKKWLKERLKTPFTWD